MRKEYHSSNVRFCMDDENQHDMESTDIDQVLQALPFSEHDSPFSQPPKHKRPYRPWQNNKNS